MANAFKLKTFSAVYGAGGSGTAADTAMTVYTGKSSTETTIIGMSIANISTSQILVSVNIESDTSDSEVNKNVFVIKDAPIPVGGTLVPIGGDQKVVLLATDVLKVTSDTANSADTTLSILEIS